jgi:hypothetical protein
MEAFDLACAPRTLRNGHSKYVRIGARGLSPIVPARPSTTQLRELDGAGPGIRLKLPYQPGGNGKRIIIQLGGGNEPPGIQLHTAGNTPVGDDVARPPARGRHDREAARAASAGIDCYQSLPAAGTSAMHPVPVRLPQHPSGNIAAIMTMTWRCVTGIPWEHEASCGPGATWACCAWSFLTRSGMGYGIFAVAVAIEEIATGSAPGRCSSSARPCLGRPRCCCRRVRDSGTQPTPPVQARAQAAYRTRAVPHHSRRPVINALRRAGSQIGQFPTDRQFATAPQLLRLNS